jgi:predicted nucleic acid-binding Zn ribbon protein
MRTMKEPQRLGKFVKAIVNSAEVRCRKLPEGLDGKWTELLGPALALRAEPIRLTEDGVLRIVTESSAIVAELTQFWQTRLLSELRKAFPKSGIRRLDFVISGKGAR